MKNETYFDALDEFYETLPERADDEMLVYLLGAVLAVYEIEDEKYVRRLFKKALEGYLDYVKDKKVH